MEYKFDIFSSGRIEKLTGFEYFEDINDDLSSEKIAVFNSNEGTAAIKITDQQELILGHYYFRGEIASSSQSFEVGRINDKIPPAILLYTWSNDSILLHGICPASRDSILFRNLFITKVSPGNKKADFTFQKLFLADLNNDSTKEIISGVQAGFRVSPRIMFIYNIVSDSLIVSDDLPAIREAVEITDLDDDGFSEILCYSYAIDNNEGRIVTDYDDHSAWLMVYDRHLNFFFPPVGFKGKYLSVNPRTIKTDGKTEIFALLQLRAPVNQAPAYLLFDTKGNLLRKKDFGVVNKYSCYTIQTIPDKPDQMMINKGKEGIHFIGSDLAEHGKEMIPGLSSASVISNDFDGDGKTEFLLQLKGSPGSYTITRNDFRHPVTFSTVNMSGSWGRYSLIRQKDAPPKIFFQSGENYLIGSYGFNLLWYFKYPVWLGIYLIVAGFLSLIRWVQQRTLRQQYESERKIANMQLLLLKNQMDPHFTFNAINAISASILEEKPQVANENLIRLSKLMRSYVLSSDQFTRSLAEELEFVNNYIELLKPQMYYDLDFKVEVDEDVDLGWEVPRAVTQTYVENAVKHGLKPLQRNGRLTIRVVRQENDLVLSIEDDGIGSAAASIHHHQGTGRGMLIMQQFYQIFNRNNKRKITCFVEDLFNDLKEAAGTRVTIRIPLGMNYSVAG